VIDESLHTLLQSLEQLTPEDQQRLADQIEEWPDNIEWTRVLNEPGHDALYDAAMDEIRQGEMRLLHLEELHL
jgi:hypothetical protein